MESILNIQHLVKTIINHQNTLHILKDINLFVKKGESVAILGKSGAGKTTLLNLLTGLDTPTQGDIVFNGISLSTQTDDQRASLRLKEMGFIFQSFRLLPEFTALQNIMLPLELQSIPLKKAKQEAFAWLEKIGLSDRASHKPSELSGGEQQRIAIARAFIHHPSIIFADEMTGNLDEETGQKMIDLLFQLNTEKHTTLFVVTHDATLANRCTSRYFLAEGKLHLHEHI